MFRKVSLLLLLLITFLSQGVLAQTFSGSQLEGVKIGQCSPLVAEIDAITRVDDVVTFTFNITNPTQYQIQDLRIVAPQSISKGPQNQVTVVTDNNRNKYMYVGVGFDGNITDGGKVNGPLPAGATKQVVIIVHNVGPDVEYLNFNVGAWTYPRNALQTKGWTFDKVPVPNQN